MTLISIYEFTGCYSLVYSNWSFIANKIAFMDWKCIFLNTSIYFDHIGEPISECLGIEKNISFEQSNILIMKKNQTTVPVINLSPLVKKTS